MDNITEIYCFAGDAYKTLNAPHPLPRPADGKKRRNRQLSVSSQAWLVS